AQLMTSNISSISAYVPEFGVFSLPYLFKTPEEILNYLATSDKAKELHAALEEKGLLILGANFYGSRCLSTKGVDLCKSPDEFKAKGIKIRCMEPQVWKDIIGAMGCTPVPIAFSELYTALQTGVVQGQDNPLANTVSQKLYEQLDKFYKTDHSYLISSFYTNPTAWDALPDDYKTLMAGQMKKHMGEEDYGVLYAQYEADGIGVLEANGVEVIEQSDIDMDSFYKAMEDMINEKYINDEVFGPIIEDIKANS
ncbi:MAG: TRAP transporter substrate-binding protein, partial [Lachnospiraceae bacterium]|nr:TRAP transporter substrate-binding protein [Lachnospiraceae bacterium]